MKKVLIVEDEDALRDIYVMLFRMNDFEVFEAANGKIALEQLKAVHPDVIVLDVLMPVMGGIEFLKLSKVKEDYADTKVLMLSNLSDPNTVAETRKLGGDKYMLKAEVAPGELVKTVTELLD